MAEVRLNWAEATVKGATLTVPLDGDVPKGWKNHFATTVKLLGHGQWGTVEVKKKAVRVDGVESGEEDNLRFYLEGLIEQANAAETGDQERDSATDDEDDSSEEPPEGSDAELTEHFRSFAEQKGEPESDSGSESESESR